jgi:hypothetical protein
MDKVLMADELDVINYETVAMHVKYFMKQIDGEPTKKELDLLKVRVLSKCPIIREFAYTFDESIWPPDQPESYKNKIQFRFSLVNRPSVFFLVFNFSDSKYFEFCIIHGK